MTGDEPGAYQLGIVRVRTPGRKRLRQARRTLQSVSPEV